MKKIIIQIILCLFALGIFFASASPVESHWEELGEKTVIGWFMEQENSIKKGWSEQNQKWYPHESLEGGNPTIAYGHKLTDEEVKNQTFKDGITEVEAGILLLSDLSKALNSLNIPDEYYKTLNEWQKFILVDYQFNLGNMKAIFPKMYVATVLKDKATMLKEYKRYYRDADGNRHELKGRNEAIYEIINTHF
tara:strand:- start:116 stop:694 length:579 start_codon:yes stop_codon:yes gene_type:complete